MCPGQPPSKPIKFDSKLTLTPRRIRIPLRVETALIERERQIGVGQFPMLGHRWRCRRRRRRCCCSHRGIVKRQRGRCRGRHLAHPLLTQTQLCRLIDNERGGGHRCCRRRHHGCASLLLRRSPIFRQPRSRWSAGQGDLRSRPITEVLPIDFPFFRGETRRHLLGTWGGGLLRSVLLLLLLLKPGRIYIAERSLGFADTPTAS